jgi:MFS transporter, UMF1 family
VKLSSIVGPITYGAVSWLSAGNHRLAILITGGYFVAGLLVLAGVNIERGRQAALEADAPAGIRRGDGR